MHSELDSKWEGLKTQILSSRVEDYRQGQPIVVFCAGDRGKFARFTLRDRGYPVAAFCDNSPQKQGTFFHGLPVLGLQDLVFKKDAFVVVAVETLRTQRMILGQLHELGVPAATIGCFLFPEIIGPIDIVYKTLLGDEKSKFVLYQYVLAHYEQESHHFQLVCEDRQYFCLDLPPGCPAETEVFLDAGAYNGDTLETYVNERKGVFGKSISFEPTAALFAQLQRRVKSICSTWGIPESKMMTVLGGVGETDGVFPLIMKDSDSNGAGNSFYDIGERVGKTVPVYSIDSFLNGEPLTFLKADIEGFELNMLKGACQTIARYKPDLAICLYHKASDIYEIPLYLHSLVPEYHMYLRHHLHDYSETVLYCSLRLPGKGKVPCSI